MIGSVWVWWRDETRRLNRYLRQALNGEPEAVLIAHGHGRGVGLDLKAGQMAVLWNGGRKGLVYRLDQFMGGELMVDNKVLIRAFRGEARRPLDEIPTAVHRMTLRLVFDNVRDPDFELELWPPADRPRPGRATPAEVIALARRWLSGAESIFRISAIKAGAPVANAPPPLYDADLFEDEAPEPPWDEADKDDEAAK